MGAKEIMGNQKFLIAGYKNINLTNMVSRLFAKMYYRS